MAVNWTKTWSASDDGTIFSGSDLQNIQSDIDTYCITVAGAQTISGNKTFSGSNILTGTFTELIKVEEHVHYENDILFSDDEIIYYR